MRLRSVELTTARPTALATFFGDDLGLATHETPDGSLVVRIGTSTLTFHPAEGDTEPFYHVAVDVPENQFPAAVEWLDDRAELLGDPDSGQSTFFFEFMNADAVYCLDPAGNVVELTARHDRSNAARGDFDSESLLNVGEIGLVAPDVPAVVEAIEAHTTARAWPESGEEFAVVGDDEGMVIVVQTGRDWYPTDVAADVYPVTIETPDASETYDFEALPYRLRPAGQD